MAWSRPIPDAQAAIFHSVPRRLRRTAVSHSAPIPKTRISVGMSMLELLRGIRVAFVSRPLNDPRGKDEFSRLDDPRRRWSSVRQRRRTERQMGVFLSE